MYFSNQKIGMAEAAMLMICEGKTTKQMWLDTGIAPEVVNGRMGHLRKKKLAGTIKSDSGTTWHRTILADMIIRNAMAQ